MSLQYVINQCVERWTTALDGFAEGGSRDVERRGSLKYIHLVFFEFINDKHVNIDFERGEPPAKRCDIIIVLARGPRDVESVVFQRGDY